MGLECDLAGGMESFTDECPGLTLDFAVIYISVGTLGLDRKRERWGIVIREPRKCQAILDGRDSYRLGMRRRRRLRKKVRASPGGVDKCFNKNYHNSSCNLLLPFPLLLWRKDDPLKRGNQK